MPGMALALSIFGLAFAAFCVWLTVRIVNRRERWAKWTLSGLISAAIAYPVSFGPACWTTSRLNLPGNWLVVAYRPMTSAIELRSGILFDAVRWYSIQGPSKDWGWWIDTNSGRVYDFAPGP
jgi:hypothetical protein